MPRSCQEALTFKIVCFSSKPICRCIRNAFQIQGLSTTHAAMSLLGTTCNPTAKLASRSLRFKSAAADDNSPQCPASPLPRATPRPLSIQLDVNIDACALTGARPPFCAEPTLLKRERIKTAGEEGCVFLPSSTEKGPDGWLPFGINGKISRRKQVKPH